MKVTRVGRQILLWAAGWLALQGVAAELTQVQLRDSDGKPVANAVVEFDAQTVDSMYPVDGEYRMDQKDYQFTPRVLIVPPGASVQFPNSDESRHHVYSFSAPKPFELQLYAGNQAPPVLFDTQGVVAIGCNIHDKMSAHIYVTDAPIALVSDGQGQVTFPRYQSGTEGDLRIWHPLLNAPVVLTPEQWSARSGGVLTVDLPMTVPIESDDKAGSSLRDRLKSFKSNGN
jgi:plastocyanin